MDVTAAVAEHKQDLNDSRRTCRNRRVQIDHHAAGAVRIDLIGTGFLPWRREVRSREVVASVITLREVAPAVEYLDAGRDRRSRVVGNAEGVFAFERRVRAAVIASACTRPDEFSRLAPGLRRSPTKEEGRPPR